MNHQKHASKATAQGIFFFLIIGLWSSLLYAQTSPVMIAQGQLDLRHWDRVKQPIINLQGHWHQASGLSNSRKRNSTLRLAPAAIWQQQPTLSKGPQSYWIDILPPASGQAAALYIDNSCSSSRAFITPADQTPSQPLIALGKVADKGVSQPYAGGKIAVLPFANNQPHRLLIETANDDFWLSGLCGTVKLGTLEALHKEHSTRLLHLAMLVAMFIAASLYSLAIYAQRPKATAPLWLALASLSTALYFFLYTGLLEAFATTQAPWLYEVHYRVLFACACWAPALMLMFYNSHYPGYLHNQLTKANLWFAAGSSLFFLATPVAMIWSVVTVAYFIWASIFLTGTWVLWRAIKDQQDYAKLFLLAAAPVTVLIPFEVISREYIGQPPFLSMYAVLFLLFIESQMVGRRYARALRLAERLSNNLRDEVALQTAELNEQNKMLASAHQALRTANKALREISNTDGLTQLYNRMYFENEFHKEWRRSSRTQSPLSVLMLDADHFKKINDSAGHKVGDLCLQAIAKTMNTHFKRAGEIVARYGGEEFIVMLPQTDQRKALAAAEGLRCAIANTVIEHQQQFFRITVSIGISTTIPSNTHSPDMMLEAADTALYEAKTAGRNRVSIVPLLNNKPIHKAQQKLL